jgi:hypothetical protein
MKLVSQAFPTFQKRSKKNTGYHLPNTVRNNQTVLALSFTFHLFKNLLQDVISLPER